jgi:hypothetical protein
VAIEEWSYNSGTEKYKLVSVENEHAHVHGQALNQRNTTTYFMETEFDFSRSCRICMMDR